MGWTKGKPTHNRIDRTNLKYGKLTALEDLGGRRWRCLCACGNFVDVLSTNLAGYARSNRGCLNCANRKNIAGERRGLLVAYACEAGVVKGRHPLWEFKCDCGGSVLGTVREFHANWLRSCGCHDSVWASWRAMMSRCYNEKDVRYPVYGKRGIKVCRRWHNFDNFVADMGERPKRHNLGRKKTEVNYTPSNCSWEHISKNCRDTKNDGMPTKPGLLKGARPRK